MSWIRPRSPIAGDCLQALWYSLVIFGFYFLLLGLLKLWMRLNDISVRSFVEENEIIGYYIVISTIGAAMLASFLMRPGARAVLIAASAASALITFLRTLPGLLVGFSVPLTDALLTTLLMFLGGAVLIAFPAVANYLALRLIDSARWAGRRAARLPRSSAAGPALRTAARLLAPAAGTAAFLAAALLGGALGDIIGYSPPLADNDRFQGAAALYAYIGAWWGGLYAAVALNISPRAAMGALPLAVAAALLAEHLDAGFLVFGPLSVFIRIDPAASALLAGVFLASPVFAKELLRRAWPRVFAGPASRAGPHQS